MGIAHLTFKFRLWHQSGDRVDNYDIDSARAHQRIGNFQRLLTGIRLRDEQFIKLNTQLLGVDRIKRMFSIDKGTFPPLFCASATQ